MEDYAAWLKGDYLLKLPEKPLELWAYEELGYLSFNSESAIT